MKYFLVKLMIFISLLSIFSLLCYQFNSYLISNTPYQTPPLTTKLILGDSHINCAIDPQIIGNSVNIAMNAEPYIISYYKLAYLLPHNPSIRTLIVGFSPHNLSAFNDIKLKDKRWAKNMFDRYYPLISYPKLQQLPIDYNKYIGRFAHHYLLPNGNYLKNYYLTKRQTTTAINHPYIGYYPQSNGSIMKSSSLKKIIHRHYYSPQDTSKFIGISSTSKVYLEKIIALCQQKNIQVVLVNAPVHPSYFQNIPSSIQHYFEDLKTELVSLPNVNLKDYGQMPLTLPDFLDYDHVNSLGAASVSKRLKQEMAWD